MGGTDTGEESAHKVNSGEENSPAASAGIRTHNLSTTSPWLFHLYPGSTADSGDAGDNVDEHDNGDNDNDDDDVDDDTLTDLPTLMPSCLVRNLEHDPGQTSKRWAMEPLVEPVGPGIRTSG